MSGWERIGLWVCGIVIGAIAGTVIYGGINLVAPALGLPGGQGPWAIVLARGAQIGGIGGAVGSLLVVLRP